MTVKLGNLLPGQVATLRLHLVNQLEIVGGQYAQALPQAFYPNYRKHGANSDEDFAYRFSYDVSIEAQSRISEISIPENAEIVEKNSTNTSIRIQCNETSRSVDLYYRTADMMAPQLFYAEDPDGSGEIACSATLVPTFDKSIALENAFNVVQGEKPESISLSEGSDYHFIFLIDRSGSM